MSIHERLRELRKSKLGQSQEKVSARLGIDSRGAYSTYETGRCNIPNDVLERFALLPDLDDSDRIFLLTGSRSLDNARMEGLEAENMSLLKENRVLRLRIDQLEGRIE